jgi:hypothetical protein
MNIEQLVDLEPAEKTEALGENLPQRHFVHNIGHQNYGTLCSIKTTLAWTVCYKNSKELKWI